MLEVTSHESESHESRVTSHESRVGRREAGGSVWPPYCRTAIPPYRHTAVPPYRRTAVPPLLFHMPEANDLVVTHELRIPLAELDYRASRSGGPGGQHVNTSSTRIELWWDIAASPSLTAEQRSRLMKRLGPKLDSSGRLRIVSSKTRSQLRNREEATERLRAVVAGALVVRKPRKPTKPSPAAKAARLDAKRRQGAKKSYRRAPDMDD
jgi:ribosome-associated protein